MDLEIAQQNNLPEKVLRFTGKTPDPNVNSTSFEFVAVEKLRITLKALVGRFCFEKETRKRFRRY
jgi:hypothetical protein